MARPKNNKNLPPYMTERNGYYQTRYPVPDEHRHLFPELTGKQAVKVIAIGPIDGKKRPHKVQLEKHSDNLDQIEARIKPSLSVSPLPATKDAGRLYHPNEVLDATEAWAVKEVRQRLLKYSNGVVPLIKPLSSEHAKVSARILSFEKWREAYGRCIVWWTETTSPNRVRNLSPSALPTNG